MTARVWKSAAIALVAFAAGAAAANVGAERGVPRAVSAATLAEPAGAPQFDPETQCVAKVPRAWGEYKGGSSQSGLAFQAQDGTLRFVTNLPCGAQPVIALKIVRIDKGGSN